MHLINIHTQIALANQHSHTDRKIPQSHFEQKH